MKKVKKGAASDSLILTGVKVLTILMSFLITRILSDRLSLPEYGEYSAAVLVVNIGSSFCILGLLDTANYFFVKEKELSGRQTIVMHLIYIEAIAAGIFAGGVILMRSSLAEYFKIPELLYDLILVAFLPFVTNLVGIYQVLFIAIQQAKLIGIFSLLFMAVKLIYIASVCYMAADVRTIFLCMLIAETVQAVLMIGIFSRKSGIRIRLERLHPEVTDAMLRFAVPMGAYIWVNTLNREIDKLVVAKLGSPEELALYTNAAKLLPLDVFTISFITVLIPYITYYLTRHQEKDAAKAFSDFLKISMIGIWSLAAGIWVDPEGLISILYGEKYIITRDIFLIYILVDMMRFAQASVLFSATHNSRLLLRCSLVMLVLNTVLNLMLYPILGMIGPAVATVVVNGVMTAYMLCRGAKLICQPVTALFPQRFAAVQIVHLAVAVTGGYTVKHFLNAAEIQPAFRFVLVYAVAAGVMVILNYRKALDLLSEINQYRMGM